MKRQNLIIRRAHSDTATEGVRYRSAAVSGFALILMFNYFGLPIAAHFGESFGQPLSGWKGL